MTDREIFCVVRHCPREINFALPNSVTSSLVLFTSLLPTFLLTYLPTFLLLSFLLSFLILCIDLPHLTSPHFTSSLLGQNTFELVTASRVLHVRATTSYEVSSWIEAIKEAIAKSYLGELSLSLSPPPLYIFFSCYYICVLF